MKLNGIKNISLLLTTFSKVLEKVMYNTLSHHVHTNNIFVSERFGFRKGISTEDADFKLRDNVLKSINQNMHVGGIFCYLAKAFYCVNHEILLTKLHFYGIQGIAAKWFRSYLTDRKQKVKISHQITLRIFSQTGGTIKHGVPQGSILRPLFFIIYINDLPPTINTLSEPIFADDTSVIISTKNFYDFCTMSNIILSHE
jgi:hypothetical protein